MSIDTPDTHKTVLEFKSTSFSVPVLVLHSNDLNQTKLQLQEKIAQAPEFFKNTPIILDLQELNTQNQKADISKLVTLLHDLDFLPVGVRGTNEEQKSAIVKLKLPALSSGNTGKQTPPPPHQNPEQAQSPAEKQEADEQPAQDPAPTVNKLIEHPIRSGQRVYARGDLTITATVSSGAEIMAEGNIHVYGTLRGKALAGVHGDSSSRIFCSNLQAELISIAGTYQISDELDDSVRNKPVQIALQDKKIIISPI